jgi:hypothetical protein
MRKTFVAAAGVIGRWLRAGPARLQPMHRCERRLDAHSRLPTPSPA